MIDALAGIRFLDPLPNLMREPAHPGQTVLGERGKNLPTVLQAICGNPKLEAVLREWACELAPMDAKCFDFIDDPFNSGQVQLLIGEMYDRKVSAYSASDGALRFLALLAALLGGHSASHGKSAARIFFFEEIDSDIHPSRLHLLLDLIEGQTAKGRIQVITTTHSSDLLAMTGDDEFNNTSVVCRLPDTRDDVIRPVCELPRLKELRHSQGLRRLHASGWMEDAIAFTWSDQTLLQVKFCP